MFPVSAPTTHLGMQTTLASSGHSSLETFQIQVGNAIYFKIEYSTVSKVRLQDQIHQLIEHLRVPIVAISMRCALLGGSSSSNVSAYPLCKLEA